jgi:phosphoglycerate dehydrogenase-like enzyme
VAAKAHKIPVIFQPTYAYNEVANHAISMIMALHRGLFQANSSTQDGKWIPAPKTAEIISLQDSSLGVIGCGRIGRNLFRLLINHPSIEIVAINDIANNKTMAHLIKYDSIHGKLPYECSFTDDVIIVNGKSHLFFHEKSLESKR